MLDPGSNFCFLNCKYNDEIQFYERIIRAQEYDNNKTYIKFNNARDGWVD